MNAKSSMERSKRRLKVFQKITGDLKEEMASRMLEIRGVYNLNKLLDALHSFGEVQMTDCSGYSYGGIIVSYYDIRVAKNVYLNLDPPYTIKYLNYNVEHDYVALTLTEYEELIPLLCSCGEIMSTNKLESYITVHFFDIRSARNAFCAINIKKESINDRNKNDLDSSVYSDSTSPSTYFFQLSPDSSRENSFEERKNRKKNTENDEKVYKINIDAIFNHEDSRTTLMIRNIPNKYTQSMLLDTINKRFVETYDFFYLPIDFKVLFI